MLSNHLLLEIPKLLVHRMVGTRIGAIFLFAPQEGTSKFASLESCAKEHQKRTHKRLQLQKEMVRQMPADNEL